MDSVILEMNLTEKELEGIEKNYFNLMSIEVNDFELNKVKIIDINKIRKRKTRTWEEITYHFPQNIFIFKLACVTFVGRKLISKRRIYGDLKEINCSGISASMILGELVNYLEDTEKIIINYQPLNHMEKMYVFKELSLDNSIDLIYPFKYLDKETKNERSSPIKGWSLNSMRAKNLALGEEYIRNYTISFLSQFNMDKKVIYDPACSTGIFLHEIKNAYPLCHTIGQDLSEQMILYAKDYVDEVYCGDSINPMIANDTSDFLFFRFLNSEVVTFEQAQKLFVRLIKCAKSEGFIIVFGHTPVLLKKEFFLDLGLKILQCTAYDEAMGLVFQYYVMQKK